MLAALLPALRELDLPLRLRLWDGREINIGPSPSVTLEIRDPELIPQLAHPSLDLLGGAYVEGKVDLHGPLDEVIRIGDELSRALGDEHADRHGAQRDQTSSGQESEPDAPNLGIERGEGAQRGNARLDKE